MFGIHTAMAGGILPLMAKVADMVWNKMYEKLNASPIPKCSPIPPFTFREESESPMAVRMKAANDIAIRRWYSTSNSLMLANPRCFCFRIYSRSCGLVIVSCWPRVMRKSCGSILMMESRRSPRVITSFIPRISLIM